MRTYQSNSKAVNYWMEEAILNFFEYRRALTQVSFLEEGMGATPNEIINLAMLDTVALADETGWSEEAIRHSIETYIQNLRTRDKQ